MKLNEDQKKIAKSYLTYSIGFVIVYPLITWLIRKEFSWDVVWVSLLTVLIVGVLNLLLIIGARSPEK